jgi:hypothetical protein
MTKLSWFGVVMGLLLMVAPVAAQETITGPDDWQATITGQVEAFRLHDAPGALSFAGQSFKEGFADPQVFLQAIVDWGYAPIVDSRSHSFGAYRLIGPDMVLQSVTFVGPDQSLYEAIYQLNLEDAGWRVGGVELIKTPGVGV